MTNEKDQAGECSDLTARPDCSEPVHTELQATRCENLRQLVEKFGGPNILARMLGYKSGSTLSQMLSSNGRRTISHQRCREYELVLALPKGYFDSPRVSFVASLTATRQMAGHAGKSHAPEPTNPS
jgi:hypothetical protein